MSLNGSANPTDTARAGLLIAGCQGSCGKTVVTTGLAAALHEEGFAVRALKPVCIGSVKSCQAELQFLSTISRTPLTYPVQYTGNGQLLNLAQWRDACRVALAGTEPVLLELPASCACPLASDGSAWRDVTDLAAELALPCLLVASHGNESYEQLLLNAAYLSRRQVRVAGLITVQTSQDSPARVSTPNMSTHLPALSDRQAIALRDRTGAPYLGCLGYSPSINVQAVNQGNLIKTTSGALDLLPVIQGLKLRISV